MKSEYLMYAKDESMKRFRPMGDGQFVVNLIHADHYQGDEARRDEHERRLRALNPSLEFKAMVCKNGLFRKEEV